MADDSVKTECAPIRYRLTLLQRTLPFFLGGLLGLLIAEGMMWAGGTPPTASATRTLITAIIGATLMNIVASRNYGVTLTAQAAIVNNARRRVINWADIERVYVEGFMGSRTIVFIDCAARKTRLRAPLGLLDKDFDAKLRTIESFWNARRLWPMTPDSEDWPRHHLGA